jgi:hypothetical protein
MVEKLEKGRGQLSLIEEFIGLSSKGYNELFLTSTLQRGDSEFE